MPSCPLCQSTGPERIGQFSVPDLITIAPQKYRSLLRLELREVDTFDAMRCGKCHLIYFHPMVTGSDRFYHTLSQDRSYYMKDKPEYDLVTPYLPKSLRLLEIGCGAGYFADRIPFPIEKYHGLEFNPAAVEQAERKGLFVTSEPIQEFAKSHAGAFNAVGSFQVLEHVADPRSFIQANLACLEKGGIFFFAVPNQDGFVGRSCDEILNLPPHHLTRWTHAAVNGLGELFGMDRVAVIEEELAAYHISFFVRTCYTHGMQKQKQVPTPFVSTQFKKNGRLAKLYRKHVLSPVLNAVGKGMEDFKPKVAGHSILGIFRKR
jgi:SAM-dependent methyltransferase